MAATKVRTGFRACICGIDLRQEPETFRCKFCDREVCSTCITRDRTRCVPCLKEHPMAVSTKSTQSAVSDDARIAERKSRKPSGVEARAAAKASILREGAGENLLSKKAEQERGDELAKKANAARKKSGQAFREEQARRKDKAKSGNKRTTGTRTANTPITSERVKRVIAMRKGGMGWPELLEALGEKRSFIHRVRPLMRKVDAESIRKTGRASEAYGNGKKAKAVKPAPKASPKVKK